ncbi:septal ring lytic transglycosylase RlpA family protein [uncultured Flavobacterium sp.]|uniref:septal ring lytic transglycosylase RlpA family protein n=1 Tax=uncultured Flavobacterium sp. TaxID=165435 RepID=UPI002930FD72|nr:septal ring lytic transglycosylase RlpA family protein [uncultured Flavobacterium sp.]
MKKLLVYIVFFIAATTTAQENQVCNEDVKIEKLKLHKENAHASYYHNKFNGRKTASGRRFDNNKLTAAHKKFPFGTKLKITNEKNDKSVIVEVIDRGPFVKGREIDLSKKAFMDITSNKKSGLMYVRIEILEN